MTESRERIMPIDLGELAKQAYEFSEVSRKHKLPFKLVVYPPSHNGLAPVMFHQVDCHMHCPNEDACSDYCNSISGEALWREIHEKSVSGNGSD